MSFKFVDTRDLGVPIPASFKRMAELQSIQRDVTSGILTVTIYAKSGSSSPEGDGVMKIIK
jgi:hypothetical protein